jgi:hypothetical protein
MDVKRIVLIYLMFASGQALAQTRSFVDTTNTWSIVSCLNFGGCSSLYSRFIGDTVVAGRTYNKLYTSPSPDMSWASLTALLREDTNHVVHAYQDPEEFVYYDMSLNVGDTFIASTHECPWEVAFTVQSIDTVVLLNGEPRRRWLLSGDWGYDAWIEGIGSIWGPFSFAVTYCTSDLYWTLNCFAQSDTLKWQVYPTCDHNTTAVNEPRMTPGTIASPNPFENRLTIRTTDACIGASIKVRNTYGQVVHLAKADLTNGYELNATDWAPGLYFVTCDCGSQSQHVQMVIKE